MTTTVTRVGKGTSRNKVFIGRPSPWGNPFIIGQDGSRREVVEKYRSWILTQPELIERMKRELTGKTLVCFCAPLPCHGDVIKEICDGEQG